MYYVGKEKKRSNYGFKGRVARAFEKFVEEIKYRSWGENGASLSKTI